ncbi:thioredoxin-like protein [Anaeromyces robustus]|uniref:Thioredoxin-like protein n=1 Tax=Anaeromyces robustus TaxID=1754192 RepID=A0A1Y1XIL1_9FUNG|nr:thioredoxin-like protein [Anaeromyces robustus]|eukprot:ORX85206.1 thioredoxin-like protein [Anaeromyces robustus]
MINPNEDTEWNDILRAHGVLPPKEPEPEEIDPNDLLPTREEILEQSTLDELDELLEDDDRRVLEKYRQKRIAEMQALARKEKYGSLITIDETNFVEEVTEASKECAVVVYMCRDSVPQCRIVTEHMKKLAERFKATKFVKYDMKAYPDRNFPTLLIYQDGQLKDQLVAFKGTDFKTIALYLHSLDVIKIEKDEVFDKKDSESESDYDSDDDY